MSEFAYRNGALCAEEVPLAEIAEAVGTPFYCYSLAALVRRYRQFESAVSAVPATVCFALKANSNLAVVSALAELGAGADVVSEGELAIARAAGIPPEKIVFSGVGKTEAEIAAALEAGILQLNVESQAEIDDVARVAKDKGKRARIAIRVNPDVAANTHAKIATGKSENKFGIDLGHAREAYARAAAMPELEVVGLAVHIGSQLTELAPFREAFTRLAALARDLKDEGLPLERLDLGGGLGVAYETEQPPALGDYARIVAETFGDLGCALVFEPGRFLTAEAGVLVTRIVRIKDGISHRFVIVDAGMNDMMRPALYEAAHPILPVRAPASDARHAPVEIVGPVCETADTFARDRQMPPLAQGDLLAILAAGAYGAVMASEYNSRPRVPEAMVNGADFAVIRARTDAPAALTHDRLPDWAAKTGRKRKEA